VLRLSGTKVSNEIKFEGVFIMVLFKTGASKTDICQL